MSKTVHVRIGKIERGAGDMSLAALLGSCVGICIYCEKKKLYMMSHCLLPQHALEANPQLPGRHVPNAIEVMVAGLINEGISPKMLQGMVFGGANVSKRLNGTSMFEVGKDNCDSAIQQLQDLGIGISQQNIGGSKARQVKIHCQTGEVLVRLLDQDRSIEEI